MAVVVVVARWENNGGLTLDFERIPPEPSIQTYSAMIEPFWSSWRYFSSCGVGLLELGSRVQTRSQETYVAIVRDDSGILKFFVRCLAVIAERNRKLTAMLTVCWEEDVVRVEEAGCDVM
jgi:hypothetical protein